jgi:hypothetical protein
VPDVVAAAMQTGSPIVGKRQVTAALTELFPTAP